MPVNVIQTLATHRKTSRKFKPDKPPISDILYTLETARQAPSGSNLQPTVYILIDDPSIKTKIRAASEEVRRDSMRTYLRIVNAVTPKRD